MITKDNGHDLWPLTLKNLFRNCCWIVCKQP